MRFFQISRHPWNTREDFTVSWSVPVIGNTKTYSIPRSDGLITRYVDQTVSPSTQKVHRVARGPFSIDATYSGAPTTSPTKPVTAHIFEGIRCRLCRKPFRGKCARTNSKRHEEEKHSDDYTERTCNVCGNIYSRPSYRRSHQEKCFLKNNAHLQLS